MFGNDHLPGGDNARESLDSSVSTPSNDIDWQAVQGALERLDGGEHA